MTGNFVIGSARKIIASNSKRGTACFLENYRDFCCRNFKKVLSLLYIPSRTAYGADLVEKSVGMGWRGRTMDLKVVNIAIGARFKINEVGAVRCPYLAGKVGTVVALGKRNT